MGSGGCVVERRIVNRGDVGSISPAAISKLRQFCSTTHLLVSFGRDTNSLQSLLFGVYVRGSKRSHRGGKCVTCSGLSNSTVLKKTNDNNGQQVDRGHLMEEE